MFFDDLRQKLLDASDVLRHTRPGAVIRAAVGRAAPRVLNDGDAGDPGATAKTAETLLDLTRRLQAEALDDRGRVDYRKLRSGPAREALDAASRALHHARPEALEGSEARIAFWLDVYNVLAIHGVIALGLERSVMEDLRFFETVAYRVGGQSYTLDEIEQGVLRRNAPHPVSGQRLFREGDPRLEVAPASLDPRIHAALVCASASCPAVRFYEQSCLDQQLEAAARHQVAEEVTVEAGRILLPLVFRYYAEDFGGEAGIRAYLLAHADAPLARALEAAAPLPLAYRRYDWSLNAAEVSEATAELRSGDG